MNVSHTAPFIEGIGIARFIEHIRWRFYFMGYDVEWANNQPKPFELNYMKLNGEAVPRFASVANIHGNTEGQRLFDNPYEAMKYMAPEMRVENGLLLTGEHLLRNLELPPREENFKTRTAKISDVTTTDFFLLDCVLAALEALPEGSDLRYDSLVGGRENYTINISVNGWKIYLRMVGDLELQVTVCEPSQAKTGPYRSIRHFNTLLTSPETVMGYLQALVDELKQKKAA